MNPRYRPSRLHQLLNDLKSSPKKSLSQNFLIDGNIIQKIIDTAELSENDTVLEIGPGPGALTEAIVQTGAKVIVVEKDRTFAKSLQSDFPGITVIEDDFLKVPIETYPKGCKVISNLPYSLTTPILTHLLPHRRTFKTLSLMMQKEVAERITSKPGNKTFGSLSLFCNYYSNPKYEFTVTKNCFYPAPKIRSAIISFELKKPPQVSDEKAFFQLVRSSFSQRRKMLRSSLSDRFSKEEIKEAFLQSQIKETARPEELSLKQFIALFEALQR